MAFPTGYLNILLQIRLTVLQGFWSMLLPALGSFFIMKQQFNEMFGVIFKKWVEPRKSPDPNHEHLSIAYHHQVEGSHWP